MEGDERELLKIFPFPIFPLMLGVNKIRRMEENEGEMLPSISLPFPTLNIPKQRE